MEKIFFNIDPYSFTTSAFIIGIILVQQLSSEEQDSIGNWLQLIGLTMQTYASQFSTLDTNKNKSTENDTCNIETLKKAIKNIEKELDKLYKNDTESK